MGRKIRPWRGIVAAGMLVLMCSGAAFATNGMELIGIGAVQRSMGGAGSALPLDSFVLTLNPAAMCELPAMVDLSLTYFDPATEYEATHNAFMGPLAGTTAKEKSSYPSSFIPALGMVYPVNDRFTLGLAAFGSAGMGVDYDAGVYGNKLFTSFEMMKVVPGLSYRINDVVSVGVALNLDRAVMGYEAAGMPKHDEDASLGIGFQAGVYLRPNEQWSVSLAYISRQWFQDFEFDTAGGKDTVALDLPQQIVFGLGFRPTERLRFALDLKWINWDQTMGKDKPAMPTHEATPAAQTFDMSWDDQLVFALGLEYDLVPDQWKLRAGYNYGRQPLSNGRAFENLAFPALVEHHFSAGVGFSPMDSLWINLGAKYAPKVTIDGRNDMQGISHYESSCQEYGIDLGFSYRF